MHLENWALYGIHRDCIASNPSLNSTQIFLQPLKNLQKICVESLGLRLEIAQLKGETPSDSLDLFPDDLAVLLARQLKVELRHVSGWLPVSVRLLEELIVPPRAVGRFLDPGEI